MDFNLWPRHVRKQIEGENMIDEVKIRLTNIKTYLSSDADPRRFWSAAPHQFFISYVISCLSSVCDILL